MAKRERIGGTKIPDFLANYIDDTGHIVLKYGEMFCGPGGLALGAMKSSVKLGQTGIRLRHKWATDYDADSCKTYRKNICPDESQTVIQADVKQLDLSSLESIDIFAYGFPCNDFSVVGEKRGFGGNFGPLYAYGLEILGHSSPVAFVAENVGGLRSTNDGQALRTILADLQAAGPGYSITPHLYKFEEYGIPQSRHRIFIVGIRNDLDLYFLPPKPTMDKGKMTARQALESPPIPSDALNHELTSQSETVIRRLKHIKPGENAWTASLPPELQLNVKKARLSHIYKRLVPDQPSYTITGSGGGGTHVYHWQEPRALTNRERARLQTFPDSFFFCGSKESVRKQIGMAVSPRMSEIVFTALLRTLIGKKYSTVTPNLAHLLNSKLLTLDI